MVTLITEQLRKQSLDEPYRNAFSFDVNVTLPVVGSSPTVSWSLCRSAPETTFPAKPSRKADPQGTSPGRDSVWPACNAVEPHHVQEGSIPEKHLQSSPPPPPSKRHCRSLSVPEDLSRCSSTWHPSVTKIWTPVKHGCQSEGTSSLCSGASSLPYCGPSSSFNSSALHSSSSPTFFSLALSTDSPLPWSFPSDPCDKLKGPCPASPTTVSSCSSSPVPLISHSTMHRRFSLSPLHILDSSRVLQHSYAPAPYRCSGTEHPALSPSPISVCSTPSSSRCDLHLALPRCHSQPCDMRKPHLKRRHDSDVPPGPRPGLDFSKMTQSGNGETLMCDTGAYVLTEDLQAKQHSAVSPVDLLGRASIRPLSESDEEGGDRINWTGTDKGQHIFERECPELDLNLIEEN